RIILLFLFSIKYFLNDKMKVLFFRFKYFMQLFLKNLIKILFYRLFKAKFYFFRLGRFLRKFQFILKQIILR
ncbi:hypothetical protein EM905_06320, partial [Campylobacter coli]|nr:hypothetical protein [Campylobacter coli]